MRYVQAVILYTLVSFMSQSCNVWSQRTALDVKFNRFYRPFRSLYIDFVARLTNSPDNKAIQERGKIQKLNADTISSSTCSSKNGPPARSPKVPNSVHRLRPGDIDIVGALGDSLTAGYGIFATNLLQVLIENRGVSWSIGGQGHWQQYLTLPNILKEFNPNLYGYSLNDSLSIDRNSRFNVAEGGAMSRDMPYMAKILVKRLKHDPHVNMTHHWKLFTLLIGSNDFCADVCYHLNPMKTIDWHEENMLKTYRYLRDNVPRLILNVVPAPNLSFLRKLNPIPLHCHTTLRMECPCVIGRSNKEMNIMQKLMDNWFQRDIDIAARDEFNSETFTINIQPFTKDYVYPTLKNGYTDNSYASEDCFHISQKHQAACANAYWNNMLQLPEEKEKLSTISLGKLLCPTNERPYLITRVNSNKNFKI
uniref:Phospholipase B1, membrane-associated n=1 Tax=Glossina brevipalpis TaxID=37001 RepID=A0A1A9WTA1_9MUSC